MKRSIIPTLSILGACLLTSCFQNETTLRLNKDGSGTLTESSSFGPQVVEMLAQFAQLGGAGEDPLSEIASEKKAKIRAAKLGEGVTLEKAEMVAKDGWKGGSVTYRFTDINKLKYAADSQGGMPAMPGGAAKIVKETPPMTFKYAGDKLTISTPEPAKSEIPAGEAGEAGEAAADPEQEKEIKKMMSDARVTFKIVIEPGIAATNATHLSENTITMIEMDLAKMMEKPGAVQRMAKLGEGDPAQAMEELKNFEGIKVETNRELTVTVK